MQQEQFYKEINTMADTAPGQCGATEMPPEMPMCCGTGCAVCVLDYPELFSQTPGLSETLAMLEAVEQAQLQARKLQTGPLMTDASGELQ